MPKIDPRTVVIRGKRWRLFSCRLGLFEGRKVCGETDPPETVGKEIRINDSLKGEEMLDTLLHEMQHAGRWELDEDVLAAFCTEQARVLWKLGYRAPWDL